MGASSSTTSSRSTSLMSCPLPVSARHYRRMAARLHSPPRREVRECPTMSDIPVLVDAKWLQAHPEVRIVDVRWAAKGPTPRERYDAGHIPGAAFVDLDRDLSRPGGP